MLFEIDIVILGKSGYPKPSNFFLIWMKNVLKDVNEDLKKLNGKIAGKSLIKFKTQSDEISFNIN